jgi:hypothetical protein
MNDLVLMLSITAETRDRLEAIATELGHSVEDCALLALSEFIETWDDYERTVAELEAGGEERPVLRAVND